MPTALHSFDLELNPVDNQRLANLCGPFDEHLRQIELRLGVEINNRGSLFRIVGDAKPAKATKKVLVNLYQTTAHQTLTAAEINLHLQESGLQELLADDVNQAADVAIKTKRGTIRGRGPNQTQYLHNIFANDINFGIGPAGTGKTFLAVACAIEALQTERMQRLVLVRPAVEAGERLGFLPGDLTQKIDPYLRPLYDALYEMIGFERTMKLIERNVIEIAPLAFMRGRTLNDAFIILDEGQNTTIEQMKMFLTRIGFGSTAVITGDITQIDLPRQQTSGLRHALSVLKGIEGISMTFFSARDVVRHPLVQSVVRAYARHDESNQQVRASQSEDAD